MPSPSDVVLAGGVEEPVARPSARAPGRVPTGTTEPAVSAPRPAPAPVAEEPLEPSDGALVRAARVGDSDAFARIVRRHGPAMHRFAVRQTGDHDDAAEAVQEAFVSAWRSLPTFRGDSSLRTWLFTLTARRAADLQRTRRPTPVDDELLSAVVRPAADNPLQDALDSELLDALRVALAELPWRQRAAWLLREIEGLSYDEIATVFGVPHASVRGHLHRGRRTLAERMARWR